MESHRISQQPPVSTPCAKDATSSLLSLSQQTGILHRRQDLDTGGSSFQSSSSTEVSSPSLSRTRPQHLTNDYHPQSNNVNSLPPHPRIAILPLQQPHPFKPSTNQSNQSLREVKPLNLLAGPYSNFNQSIAVGMTVSVKVKDVWYNGIVTLVDTTPLTNVIVKVEVTYQDEKDKRITKVFNWPGEDIGIADGALLGEYHERRLNNDIKMFACGIDDCLYKAPESCRVSPPGARANKNNSLLLLV